MWFRSHNKAFHFFLCSFIVSPIYQRFIRKAPTFVSLHLFILPLRWNAFYKALYPLRFLIRVDNFVPQAYANFLRDQTLRYNASELRTFSYALQSHYYLTTVSAFVQMFAFSKHDF